jgi:hypothetical protein
MSPRHRGAQSLRSPAPAPVPTSFELKSVGTEKLSSSTTATRTACTRRRGNPLAHGRPRFRGGAAVPLDSARKRRPGGFPRVDGAHLRCTSAWPATSTCSSRSSARPCSDRAQCARIAALAAGLAGLPRQVELGGRELSRLHDQIHRGERRQHVRLRAAAPPCAVTQSPSTTSGLPDSPSRCTASPTSPAPHFGWHSDQAGGQTSTRKISISIQLSEMDRVQPVGDFEFCPTA